MVDEGRPTAPDEPDRLGTIAVDLRAAARRYGTPLYLTDAATLAAAADEARAAFPDPWIRQYSVKANDFAQFSRRNMAQSFRPANTGQRHEAQNHQNM